MIEYIDVHKAFDVPVLSGVSLTVAGLGDREFDVQVIPYTWEHTTLRSLRPNDKVNLECDMIGKYVVRSLEARKS